MSVSHHTAGVYIDKVSVLVISVNMTVLDLLTFGSLFCAVINILYTFELEFLSFFRTVGVSEVVTDIEGAVELHVVLSQMLMLGDYAVHIVIAHSEGVGCRLVVGSGVCTRSGGETI